MSPYELVGRILVLCSSLTSVTARLTVNPSNTVAVFGQSVTVMNCSTSLPDPVDWWWIPTGTTELIPIVQSNTLVYLYDYHIEVRLGDNGQQNLVIFDVTFKDAGRYTCFDEGRLQTPVDKGYFASAELVVIDKSLTCSDNMSVDGVVGGDICGLGLQPDYINNTCSVRFSGNVAPTLLWSKNDVTSRDVSNFTVPNLRVTSTVIVKADEHRNGSQFTCSARMVWPSSNLSSQPLNLKWTSKFLNKLWFSYNKTQAIPITELVCPPKQTTCSIDASESILKTCEYKWSLNTTSLTAHSSILVLTAFASWWGLFICTVTCTVRGRTCRVNPLIVDSTMCPGPEFLTENSTRINFTQTFTAKHTEVIVEDGKAFIASVFLGITLGCVLALIIGTVLVLTRSRKTRISVVRHYLQNNNDIDVGADPN